MGIAAVAILVIVGYFYLDSQNAVSVVSNENAVLIQDQPSGDNTVVTYAKLSKAGHIVVLEANPQTGETVILGASEVLQAGEHKNVSVAHYNGARSNQGSAIAAILVADNGDGTFSQADDTEVLADETVPTVTATVYDGASIEVPPTDEELAQLLANAGYTVTGADAMSLDAPLEQAAPTEDAPMTDEMATSSEEAMDTSTSTETDTADTEVETAI